MTARPEQQAGVADCDLGGMRALVTGSTSGIGREIALAVGRLGADVLVHGRNADAGARVVDELHSLGREARFVSADFASVGEVRALAAAVGEWTDELDLLFHNAGGLFGESKLTELGVEYTFHVNHLSAYLLTAELFSTLTPDARIITTSSAAHRGVTLDLGTVQSVDDYSAFRAYQRSKLANIQFTTELARRLAADEQAGNEITANAFHPGAIPGSGFARFLPGPLPRLVNAARVLPFVPTVVDGATTPVFLAGSPRVDGVSGRYFANCEPKAPSEPARDRTAQRRLFERSAELLGIDEPLQPDV